MDIKVRKEALLQEYEKANTSRALEQRVIGLLAQVKILEELAEGGNE